jgi:hypothetical protein
MTVTDQLAAGAEVLGPGDCIHLLQSHHVGRIAFAHQAFPVIVPVTYVYQDPNVVIRTGPGANLDDVPLRAVTFEIDDVDPDGTWAWSVIVDGPAADISDSLDDVNRQLPTAPVVPSAPAGPVRWLKITARRISGRRFGPVPQGNYDMKPHDRTGT